MAFRQYFLVSFLACFVLTSCTSEEEHQSEPYDLAITNVDVYDSRHAAILTNKTIFIRDDRIAKIADTGGAEPASEIIDGKGRLATPGFIDTHTHVLLNYGDGGFGPKAIKDEYRNVHMRDFLQYGVTTIADMGQPKEWLPIMKHWQSTPTANHPNFLIVGGSLNSKHDWDTAPPMHHHNLACPQDAIDAVNAYHNQGIGRIKLYWKLEQSDMAVIIDQANKLDMEFYAHVDNGIRKYRFRKCGSSKNYQINFISILVKFPLKFILGAENDGNHLMVRNISMFTEL